MDCFRWMLALVSLALCVCLNYLGLEFIQKFTYIPCNHILVYTIYSAHPLFNKVFLYFLVLVSCLITFLSLDWLTRIPITGGQVGHVSIDKKHINPENFLEQNKTRSDSRNVMCECHPLEFPGHLDLRQSKRKDGISFPGMQVVGLCLILDSAFLSLGYHLNFTADTQKSINSSSFRESGCSLVQPPTCSWSLWCGRLLQLCPNLTLRHHCSLSRLHLCVAIHTATFFFLKGT